MTDRQCEPDRWPGCDGPDLESQQAELDRIRDDIRNIYATIAALKLRHGQPALYDRDEEF